MSLPTTPIIRVCRKRSADPHSGVVLQLKKSKADPMFFTLFRTSDLPLDDIHNSQFIEFRNTGLQEINSVQNEVVNPLAFANDSIGEVGGPEHTRTVADDTITVNGRALVPASNPEELVFDYYKFSRGTVMDELDQFDPELEMRFATSEEELLMFDDDDTGSEKYQDDDDSNEENNWRNDYPDEDVLSDDYDIDDSDDLDVDSGSDGLMLRMQRFGIHLEEESGDEDDYA